jgi:hypothetical protein
MISIQGGPPQVVSWFITPFTSSIYLPYRFQILSTCEIFCGNPSNLHWQLWEFLPRVSTSKSCQVDVGCVALFRKIEVTVGKWRFNGGLVGGTYKKPCVIHGCLLESIGVMWVQNPRWIPSLHTSRGGARRYESLSWFRSDRFVMYLAIPPERSESEFVYIYIPFWTAQGGSLVGKNAKQKYFTSSDPNHDIILS